MLLVRRSLVFVAIFTFVTLAGPILVSADEPAVLERREIELPGHRILSLSPDGALIATATTDLSRLCIFDSVTLAERVCTDLAPLDAGLRMEDVVWSPDSTKLVLAELSFVRLVDGDLWLMDAVSGDLTNLTDDGVNARLPWNTDEKPKFTELFFDISPTWLPDGSGITFSRSTWRDGEWAGNTIETIPVTGGEPTSLITISPDTPGVVYFGMRWTADASHLFYSVYFVDNSNPNNGIWSVNADGSGAVKVLGSDPDYGPPIVSGISPDGNTLLAFYPLPAGQFAAPERPLFSLLNVASGEGTPVEIQSNDVSDYVFAQPVVLSPDGSLLVYAGRLTTPDFVIYARSISDSIESVLVPEGLPGAAPIATTASISWSNDGQLLFLSAPDKGTILRIKGGVDFSPVPAATPAPIEPTATPDDSVDGNTPEVGSTVTTNDNDVPLRSAPGTDGQTVATLSIGVELTVVGPPVETGGHTWLPVTDPANGTIGYIRIEFVDTSA